jgi:hypothetical protein
MVKGPISPPEKFRIVPAQSEDRDTDRYLEVSGGNKGLHDDRYYDSVRFAYGTGGGGSGGSVSAVGG